MTGNPLELFRKFSVVVRATFWGGFVSPFCQKFRKGVGGQRGLARGNPLKARDSGLFSVPFSLPPLGEGGHISGELLGFFLGVRLSPTPSRQPLFELLILAPDLSLRATLGIGGKPKVQPTHPLKSRERPLRKGSTCILATLSPVRQGLLPCSMALLLFCRHPTVHHGGRRPALYLCSPKPCFACRGGCAIL